MKRLTNAEKAELHKQLEEAEKAKFKPYENKIAELEKENAELKEKLKPENCLKLLAKDGYIKFTSEQLTKAKELLAKWVELYRPKLEGYSITPIQEQTEQFLNEVEK